MWSTGPSVRRSTSCAALMSSLRAASSDASCSAGTGGILLTWTALDSAKLGLEVPVA